MSHAVLPARDQTANVTGRPRRNGPSFGWLVLIGMVAGLVLGFIARDFAITPLATALQIVGDAFVQLLRLLVAPLVFAAIIASVAALDAMEDAARLLARTLGWFAITTLCAVTIGLALGIVLQPGVHDAVGGGTAAPPRAIGSWLDFLRGLIPGNIFAIEATTKLTDEAARTTIGFNILQVIVLAAALGIAAVRSGEAAQPFLAFNAAVLVMLRRVLGWIIRLSPIGSGALIGSAIVRYGWGSLSSLGVFAAAVYLGLALVLFGVYPLLLLARGMNPRRFFAAAWPAIQLGFVSRSSIAALPVTQDVVTERLGVRRDYAAFAVPFAATTKMDGCAAVYPAIAALFVAQYYGIALGIGDYLLIAIVSVLGSAATAGLTGALVMLTLTLSTLGLPLEGAGLLLAIDPIIDMGRTAVNVAGQALVPLLVSPPQVQAPGQAGARMPA